MKPRLTLVGLLTSARLALSQTSLPTCAQTCANSSFSASGCSSLDVKCICASQAVLNEIACCITSSCSTSDTNSAVDFLDSLCSATGVSVPRILVCNNATTVTRAPTGSSSTSTSSSSSGGGGGSSTSSTGTATPPAAATTKNTSAGSTPTAAADDGDGGSGLSPGAKAGIGVGVGVGGLLVLAAVAFFLYRRRGRRTAAPVVGSELQDTQRFEKDGTEAQRYEKDGVEVQPWQQHPPPPPPQEMPTGPPERWGELAG